MRMGCAGLPELIICRKDELAFKSRPGTTGKGIGEVDIFAWWFMGARSVFRGDGDFGVGAELSREGLSCSWYS